MNVSNKPQEYVVVFQSLSHVQLFVTPWTATRQAFLSFTISQSLLKLKSTASVMPSNHLVPFSSCLQSFLASGSFQMSQLVASGQSIRASPSTSVLPMNIQDWFPLGLTGLISLVSKGLSRVFSSTTIWKHQFFSTQPSLPEKAMAPHSSTLAWKIPWTEEPGRLQSMRSLSWTQLSNFTFTFHFSLSCIGEGNGNPLQCSCLENPRDGGVW